MKPPAAAPKPASTTGSRKRTKAGVEGGTIPQAGKNHAKGGQPVTIDDEARALAAMMIEQTGDPERVAAELGNTISQAAASLIASAASKGPAAIPSLALLGRIIGATWAAKPTDAGNKAANAQALVAALQGALSRGPNGVRVTPAGSSALSGHVLDTEKRTKPVEPLDF
jgi:hypothetical protein